MLLPKDEYVRKRIHNGCSVQMKILSLGITAWHHLASLVMSNSHPSDRIFNPHLTTIKDLYRNDPKFSDS